jgi:flavin-dependent dehydrogenase
MRVGIVGAGIVGSYLGYLLAGKRIPGSDEPVNITIFDRKSGFGDKPCSGLISERIWNFIPKPPSEQYHGLVEHEIDDVRIHFDTGKIVSLKFRPKMLVFDRQKLDEYVGLLARKKGVKFVREQVIDVFEGGLRADKEYEFDRIVGCDGANSTVRREMGWKEPKFRQGIYCYTREKCADNHVDTWHLPQGFAWKIPRGDAVEWGVVAPMGEAKQAFDLLMRKQGVVSEKVFSHVIPEGLRIPDSVESVNITLCGDAAGLTKPWSGGGVIWGMTAAKILADSFPDFGVYGQEIEKKFGFKIWMGQKARKMLEIPLVLNMLPMNIGFDGDWLI